MLKWSKFSRSYGLSAFQRRANIATRAHLRGFVAPRDPITFEMLCEIMADLHISEESAKKICRDRGCTSKEYRYLED
jgi:hypothetical protein